MKFLGMDKVVCLSPHPDDIEYSLSGTVLKYYETTFYVLSLTKGGAPGFDVSNEKFDRRGEVDEFWKRLHPDDVDWMKLNWEKAEAHKKPYSGTFLFI